MKISAFADKVRLDILSSSNHLGIAFDPDYECR